MSKGSNIRPYDKKKYDNNFKRIFKMNPVKKNMDKFHKPSTHPDKTKYDRKSENDEIERMIDEGGPAGVDYREVQRQMTDLNWDGE